MPIFPEAVVLHVMEPVLHTPVAAEERQEFGRRGLRRGEAGGEVADAVPTLARPGVDYLLVDFSHLLEAGKVTVASEGRGDPQGPPFDPAVPLFYCPERGLQPGWGGVGKEFL